MKIGVIGSRNLEYDLETVLPANVKTIVSGGAKGIDTCAKNYANKNKLELIEFLPDYKQYGRKAPIIRNKTIIENSDMIIAIWDGQSKGTKYTIDLARKMNKEVQVIICQSEKNIF